MDDHTRELSALAAPQNRKRRNRRRCRSTILNTLGETLSDSLVQTSEALLTEAQRISDDLLTDARRLANDARTLAADIRNASGRAKQAVGRYQHQNAGCRRANAGGATKVQWVVVMNVLDLFSGIGGFSLGLERAECEPAPSAKSIPIAGPCSRKHWPNVPIYDDVNLRSELRHADYQRQLQPQGSKRNEWQWLRLRLISICGGFSVPRHFRCRKGAGITGERSGLWKRVRPNYWRDTTPLRHRGERRSVACIEGLQTFCGDLAALGYDAEWHCIPASAVGAPHRRDRVWIIAYPQHPDADSERSHRTPQHVNGDAETSRRTSPCRWTGLPRCGRRRPAATGRMAPRRVAAICR